MKRPRPAPPFFPYHDHRNMAQVFQQERLEAMRKQPPIGRHVKKWSEADRLKDAENAYARALERKDW